MSLGIRKGDDVMVISGTHKGARGKILSIDRTRERAIVEGVNFITKHERVNPQTGQGGRTEREAPIHVSNLALVCPKTNKPTRIRVKISEQKAADGKKRRVKERVSVRAERELGETIVIPTRS
jgi:large subunit ribosomal protein L24